MSDEKICYLTKKDGEEKVESEELEAVGEASIGISRESCTPTDMKLALQDALENAQRKCDEEYDCVGEKCDERQICLMGVQATKTRTVGFVKEELGGKCMIKIKFRCECRCIEPPISFFTPRNIDNENNSENNEDSDSWDYWDWGHYRMG